MFIATIVILADLCEAPWGPHRVMAAGPGHFGVAGGLAGLGLQVSDLMFAVQGNQNDL